MSELDDEMLEQYIALHERSKHPLIVVRVAEARKRLAEMDRARADLLIAALKGQP